MMSWVLCLALCATSVLADIINIVDKVDIKVLQERQMGILQVLSHVPEPLYLKKLQDIASTWTIEKNINEYNNVDVALQFAAMIKNKWILPRNVPYAVYEPAHIFETILAFTVLYTAKTYDAFFNSSVYFREILNEGLFVYVFGVAILHRPDTQGLTVPPIYNISPNYYTSADVLFSGERINAQGKDLVAKYPNTYIKDGSVVIKEDGTLWARPKNQLNNVSYFTQDRSLNAMYYYFNLEYPYWSASNVSGLNKDRRGEMWLYILKQIVAGYYLNRLSNGLGEIPALSDEIAEGYSPGLLYGNGIPFPSRPDNFRINQNKFATKLEAAKEYERRIWEAIDKGFYVTPSGELKSLNNDDGADILGRLIQSNADSPNSYFYKDFLRLYASIVGNSIFNSVDLSDELFPLLVPSATENYHTALRDSAYYIVLNRILNLYNKWSKGQKSYTPNELTAPGIEIEKVETDKISTFFEESFFDITNALPLNANERKLGYDEVSVFARQPRLNHRPYQVVVAVKSNRAKTVLIKLFLLIKNIKIDVRLNTHYDYQIDEFIHEVKAGENVIIRKSIDNEWFVRDWLSSDELYKKVASGQWVPDASQSIKKFPDNLMLPKGTTNGMTYRLVVFIDNLPETSLIDNLAAPLGLGSGKRYKYDKPLGYPLNRPLYTWQVAKVKNLFFQDVVIYHEG